MADKHSIPNESDPLPEDVLHEIAAVFKVLGDPTRVQLIYLLTKREYSVNELSRLVPVSPSAVSHHLAKLRDLRLVRTRREANQIFYSIDDSHVEGFFREALYHLDHIRRNIPDHPYDQQ